MLHLTIKKEKAAGRSKLLDQANRAAQDLLQNESNRVLVVYGDEVASIYCDDGTKVPRQAS